MDWMPLPLKKITDCGANPCPFTVSTNPGEPAETLGGVVEVTVGEGFFATPPPQEASSSAATNTSRFWSELFLFKSPAPCYLDRLITPTRSLRTRSTACGAHRSGNWNRRDY